jgi:chorismate mutase/prephenate dehydratase
MDLETIRQHIDKVDDEILTLFLKRMDLVKQVAAYKKANNVGVADKKREREIIARVIKDNGECETYIRMLFSEIFDLSRSYQIRAAGGGNALSERITNAYRQTPELFPKKATVACQGVHGAYSQRACDKLFPMANIMYFTGFEGVFGAVERDLCDYGILPVENSTYGSVNEVYDLMSSKSFHIVRGVKLRISHDLLAAPGVKKEDITEIISHKQALGQCKAFLKTLPKQVAVKEVDNTAIAAQYAASHQGVAAIAAPECADYYGLNVLGENIQDSDNNYTRFICISRNLEIYPGSNRISIMISLPHEPGSLYSLLGKFAALGYNLEKLESRPVPGQDFRFMFYFDFAACVADENVTRLLGEMSEQYRNFVFFGNYLEV